MQKKYEESGKFTVFLSNVQYNNAESVQFLKQAGINFPAYYQVLLPHAPCPGPIPHAVLFDHKGRVVKTGRPDTLIPLVDALVKATPQPARPILGEIQVQHCIAEAAALRRGAVILWQLKALDKYAARDDAKGVEAKALSLQVRKWIGLESARLKELSARQPANAALELQTFCKQLAKLPEQEPMQTLLKSLTGDKFVKSLVNSMREAARVRARIKKSGSSKSTDAALERIRKKLRKMAATEGVPAVVAKEAVEFASGLED